jgi:hypothetical protein
VISVKPNTKIFKPIVSRQLINQMSGDIIKSLATPVIIKQKDPDITSNAFLFNVKLLKKI